MRFEILDQAGIVINTIMADADFMAENFENYRLADQPPVDFDAIWEEIKKLRDSKSDTGGYPVGQFWFHSDLRSRSQQHGLARMADKAGAAGGDMDQPFEISEGQPLVWKTMSSAFVSMTPNLAHSIFDAAALQDAALFTHAETLNAQIRAALDPQSIDITAGWPVVYGD